MTYIVYCSQSRFQKNITLFFLGIFLVFSLKTTLISQPNFTANDQVTPYNGAFRPGYNPGYFPGWDDKGLANLAAGNPALSISGAGTKSARQGLFFDLMRTWGFGVRLPEVQHFEALGMGELTGLILGGANGGSQPNPPDDVRDLTQYCPGTPSDLFANLYKPIWDGGANGTPYNEENYYAAYLYQTVLTYKDYVRFWEIWNEPGYDFTGNKGWRAAGDTNGNWWDNNPDPCDYKLHAPIQHYIRMLRISWEIIKTVNPDSYVCMSSPGYQSFLDAILRNTDNPMDGSVNSDYPVKGGAYFDCLAYHSYPHFDGTTVLNPIPPAQYMRTSDRCAEGIADKRNYFQIVLNQRGYDGITYPKKEFIVTEINLPRKSFGNAAYFGSDLAQRNFTIKAVVESKIEKIHQLHFYTLSELKTESNAGYEFDLMGLYKNITNLPATSVQLTEEGIALKTASDLLFNTVYDPILTQSLNIPNNIKVFAFKQPDGKYVFACWAKTNTDLSEAASASYSFPLNVTTGGQKYEWNWSQTGAVSNVGSLNLTLTGTPIFIVADATVPTSDIKFEPFFQVNPNPLSNQGTISFNLLNSEEVEVSLLDAIGKTTQTIFKGTSQSGENILVFDRKKVNNGLYFIQLKSKSGIAVKKIIIE
jgi:Secretion system C-terminal sorting domain